MDKFKVQKPIPRTSADLRSQHRNYTPAVTVNSANKSLRLTIIRRAVICAGAILATVLGFYLSLIITAEPLDAEQNAQVSEAIKIIEKNGFAAEAFYLKNFAVFRGGDNWLNSTVAKENAYAATNFPFAIVTLYPDFFAYTHDDTERAAILLHEVKHLEGLDEEKAYAFVWSRKKEIGWTRENYSKSIVWKEIRKQTREHAPHLFVCDFNSYDDCTE